MGRNSDFLILAQIVAFPSIREQLNRLLSRVEILLPTLFFRGEWARYSVG
jgi:hypothetical protein